MSFSVISQNFIFFGVGVQNFPFGATWRAPPKQYKNRDFSKPFKKHMRHETAIFGPKKQNPEIPVIICFAYKKFLLFQQQKTQNLLKPPIL